MAETPIDDLLVIDWYDGPVTAVCTLDTGKTVLVLLLAVDLDSDERIYGLVPITPDDAATLRSMVGESGRPLSSVDLPGRNYGRSILIVGVVQVSQCAGFLESPPAFRAFTTILYEPSGTTFR